MVTDRLWNEECRRKSVEVVPSDSNALVSEKQERWGGSQNNRIMITPDEDLIPRGETLSTFTVSKRVI